MSPRRTTLVSGIVSSMASFMRDFLGWFCIGGLMLPGCAGRGGPLIAIGTVVSLTGAVVTAKSIDSYSPGEETLGRVGLGMVVTGLVLVLVGVGIPDAPAAPTAATMIPRR